MKVEKEKGGKKVFKSYKNYKKRENMGKENKIQKVCVESSAKTEA